MGTKRVALMVLLVGLLVAAGLLTACGGGSSGGSTDVGNGDVGNGDVGNGDVGNGDVGNGDVGSIDVGNGDVGNGDDSAADIAADDTFTDLRDGKVYQTVTIGTQVWMAENLAYLPSVVTPSTESTTTGYYYVYGYDGTDVVDAKATANYTTYGVLYNWPAAMAGASSSAANPSAVQGVCPTGWHLPSDEEWTALTTFLGGVGIAGGELKETDTTHWATPNTGATNGSGFTALPGGYLSSENTFKSIGEGGLWWTATEFNMSNALDREIYFDGGNVFTPNIDKAIGASVRCVKD